MNSSTKNLVQKEAERYANLKITFNELMSLTKTEAIYYCVNDFLAGAEYMGSIDEKTYEPIPLIEEKKESEMESELNFVSDVVRNSDFDLGFRTGWVKSWSHHKSPPADQQGEKREEGGTKLVQKEMNERSFRNMNDDLPGYVGDRIKKEMEGYQSYNHPARKVFNDVCWRVYGCTPDMLFDNKHNNSSAFWLDLILPAMQQFATPHSQPGQEVMREAAEFVGAMGDQHTDKVKQLLYKTIIQWEKQRQ